MVQIRNLSGSDVERRDLGEAESMGKNENIIGRVSIRGRNLNGLWGYSLVQVARHVRPYLVSFSCIDY